ncbi:MAG: hypothetical protein LBK99_19740 [Opitutaceae bacterium]|nr:hypothetical protein [Opitutaceae bacterium]
MAVGVGGSELVAEKIAAREEEFKKTLGRDPLHFVCNGRRGDGSGQGGGGGGGNRWGGGGGGGAGGEEREDDADYVFYPDSGYLSGGIA